MTYAVFPLFNLFIYYFNILFEGELCVDPRPAVRKSAGQTLFSTISAHGSLLKQSTWQAVLWQVLFPLLDKVRNLSSSASSEKVDTGGNILIHHSRNTAQKQWAETQVLTLSGVARVFNTKRQLLQMLGDFPRAWSLLLEFIENSALNKNNEVSLAALKSFQEILYLSKTQGTDNGGFNCPPSEELDMWLVAWRVWLNIGTEITVPLVENENIDDIYLPSQSFLTALVLIFPNVFQHIKNKFYIEDLKQLCSVLTNAVTVPVHGESAPYILSSVSDITLTTLHDGVLHSMELLQKEAISGNNDSMIPEIFKQLLTFGKFTCQPPSFTKSTETKNIKGTASEWIMMNYIPFGEKAITMAVKLYEKTAEYEDVIEANVLHDIIGALHVPLSLKYNCVSSSTWKLSAGSLLTVLQIGLPVARAHPAKFSSMWPQLANTLNHFLFPNSVAPPDRGLDDLVSDEATDCQLIELLRNEVLPYSHQIPKHFILKVVVLLNKGSIHSATNAELDSETELTLREEFAKTCFETLLQFSLIDDSKEAIVFSGDENEGGVAGRLAVTALLHRFQEVLKKYIDDEKQSGKCPLPR